MRRSAMMLLWTKYAFSVVVSGMSGIFARQARQMNRKEERKGKHIHRSELDKTNWNLIEIMQKKPKKESREFTNIVSRETDNVQRFVGTDRQRGREVDRRKHSKRKRIKETWRERGERDVSTRPV